MLGNLFCIQTFIVARLCKTNGESCEFSGWSCTRSHGGKNGRVHPATKEARHRDIGKHVGLDGIFEQSADP